VAFERMWSDMVVFPTPAVPATRTVEGVTKPPRISSKPGIPHDNFWNSVIYCPLYRGYLAFIYSFVKYIGWHLKILFTI
jgi:hypothetical protein